MQERQQTSRTLSLITHEEDGHFIINMHALHNATLLHKVLPRHLTAPKPLYADRRARHYEIAAGLRVTQTEKRAHTAAKAKATREANKRRKNNQQAAVVGEHESDIGSDVGAKSDTAGNTHQGRNKRPRAEARNDRL